MLRARTSPSRFTTRAPLKAAKGPCNLSASASGIMLRGGRELARESAMPRSYSFTAAVLVASVTSWFEVTRVPSMSDITRAIGEGLFTVIETYLSIRNTQSERVAVCPVFGPRTVDFQSAEDVP